MANCACLKADTGARIWATHQYTTKASVRWGNAFLVEQADRYILFNEGGELIIAKFTPKGHEEISRARFWSRPTPWRAAVSFGPTRLSRIAPFMPAMIWK